MRQTATIQKALAKAIANVTTSTTNTEGKRTLLRPYLSATGPSTIAPIVHPKNNMAFASQPKKPRLQTKSN